MDYMMVAIKFIFILSRKLIRVFSLIYNIFLICILFVNLKRVKVLRKMARCSVDSDASSSNSELLSRLVSPSSATSLRGAPSPSILSKLVSRDRMHNCNKTNGDVKNGIVYQNEFIHCSCKCLCCLCSKLVLSPPRLLTELFLPPLSLSFENGRFHSQA